MNISVRLTNKDYHISGLWRLKDLQKKFECENTTLLDAPSVRTEQRENTCSRLSGLQRPETRRWPTSTSHFLPSCV